MALRSEGFDVVSGPVDFDLKLELGRIVLDIRAPTSVGNTVFTRFSIQENSPIYELLFMATGIIGSEIDNGDSPLDAYEFFYPDYNFDKLKQGDGTTLYFIESKLYGDKIAFASRSFVFPPGFG